MEKKEQVFQHIHLDTLNKIKNNEFENIGLDALGISLDLKMDRANISRLLNQLYNEGRLIKTSTRPVLFVDRSSLDSAFQNSHIPSIIPKNKNIQDYIFEQSENNIQNHINSFSRYITNPRHSKMYEPIKKAKSALLYPYGLNTLIFGELGSGRFQFAKAMANYAKEIKFIDEKSKPDIIECLAYTMANEDVLIRLLFGEYISKSDTLKKGIFQTSQNNIVILNNIDQLPSRTLSTIYNAILDNSFTPLNYNKSYKLSSLIIGTATTQSILKNTDIRRCFPMLIDIPNLHDRSIAEKLVIILQYLQDEALLIDKTIRISKDALSCFVMSEYKGNLAHLRAEIRQACAMGYQKYIDNNSFFIDIGFDEISTPVLTNIFDINERMSELYDTLNLFKNDYLFFSTHQQNPELLLLYDLNQKTSNEFSNVQKTDEELINLCIADIDSASNIQLNTIRSILVHEIYDVVYPLLENHSICKNENLLYGLLLHISNEINRINSNQSPSSFPKLTSKIARSNDYSYAQKVKKSIENHYKISCSDTEVDYIATYLYLSSQWIDKKYIQLLIASTDNETAKNYADYLNSQNFKTYASYIALSSSQTIYENMTILCKKMEQIDRGKGVILVTDYPSIQKLQFLLSKQYHGDFVILNDMSVQNLVSISEKIESLGITLQSINTFDENESSQINQISSIESHAQDLLHDIQEKLLSESLVFLNPEKACKSLFNVLLNIINDLSIQYSDDLLIKFLFHMSFTLERCIRKEPYAYPKARSLIKNNSDLYNILDKNLKILNEIFSIQIPTGEMGFIIEIFLPYIHA